MGKEYTEIDDRIQNWMSRQHIFFVATAPRADDGLINCSPKGLDSLKVLGPSELAYIDTGGSGIETVAHVRENGRIVLMMCAFDGPPKIYRFYGKGEVALPQDKGFDELLTCFPSMPAARNIIRIKVDRIIDSCGFGVPMYEFRKDRDSLTNYFESKSEEDIRDYRKNRNSQSLDGLPGLDVPENI